MVDALALRTERLVMLPLGPADIDEIAALHADIEVMRHVAGGTMTRAQTIDALARSERCWRSNDWGMWAIRNAETGGLVGAGGLQPDSMIDGAVADFCLTLGRRIRSTGISTEAAAAILDDAWQRFDGDVIHSIIAADSPAMSSLLRIVGFTDAGTITISGQPHETWVISRVSSQRR